MDEASKQAVGQIAMGLAEAISPILPLTGSDHGARWTVTVAHGGASISADINIDELFAPVTRGGKRDDA
jgi:hypothetical protein